MKKLLIASLTFGLTFIAYGQSIISKNLYTANPVQINPAYMGSQGKLFMGFQSSLSGSNELNFPTYTSFNIHSSLFDNLAVGTNFLSERQGPFSLTSADVGSVYKANLNHRQSLSFGMTIGFIRQTLNPSSFSANPFVNQDDPLLSAQFYDQTHVKIGSGLVYRFENLEVSLGSPYLFRGGETFNKDANLLAGYTFLLSQNRIKLNPTVLYQIKQNDADLYDINVRGMYANKVWLQLGYRSSQSMNLAFGLSMELFDLGYNYNSAMGGSRDVNIGGHEILMAFTIREKSRNRISQNSRSSYRKVNKGEMDNQLTKTRHEYDSLARIVSINQSKEKTKNALLQEENELLRSQINGIQQELGVVKANQESEEIRDELLSDKISIEPGNYIVLSTCKTLLRAEEVQLELRAKGENGAKIILNRDKGFFYITSSRYSNFNEAVKSLKDHRERGYKDSWVLVYKE